MPTLAPVSTGRHHTISVTTEHPTQFVDLTDRLEAFVAAAGIAVGFVNVQALHTTTASVVNELEPLLLDDFGVLLEQLASASAGYRHDDMSARAVNLTPDERINGHAHCRALLLGSSACINVADGRLLLGRWQRVLMAELDGPRTRDISVAIVGERFA
jgi:secondary thiamine-phosphate synthase enzyme